MWLLEAGDGLWAGCRAGAASISSRSSLHAVVPLPWPCSPTGPPGGLQRGADGVSRVPRCFRAGLSLCLPCAPWLGGLGGCSTAVLLRCARPRARLSLPASVSRLASGHRNEFPTVCGPGTVTTGSFLKLCVSEHASMNHFASLHEDYTFF